MNMDDEQVAREVNAALAKFAFEVECALALIMDESLKRGSAHQVYVAMRCAAILGAQGAHASTAVLASCKQDSRDIVRAMLVRNMQMELRTLQETERKFAEEPVMPVVVPGPSGVRS